MKILVLVLLTFCALLQVHGNEQDDEVLHPAVISNINRRIDRIIRHHDAAYPIKSRRDAQLHYKLKELHETKLETGDTDVDEDIALSAILHFHVFLRNFEKLQFLAVEAEGELISLMKQSHLNDHQAKDALQVLHMLRTSNEEGSTEDILRALRAYKTYKIHEVYGEELEEEQREKSEEESSEESGEDDYSEHANEYENQQHSENEDEDENGSAELWNGPRQHYLQRVPLISRDDGNRQRTWVDSDILRELAIALRQDFDNNRDVDYFRD